MIRVLLVDEDQIVRCGVALYGLDPANQDPAAAGLHPALLLRSYVAAVKRAEPGDSAGYGRRWIAEALHIRASRIGNQPGGESGVTQPAGKPLLNPPPSKGEIPDAAADVQAARP